MQIEDHLAIIDGALDDIAADSSISLAEYAIVMDEIAYRVKAAAQAAQDDLVRA